MRRRHTMVAALVARDFDENSFVNFLWGMLNCFEDFDNFGENSEKVFVEVGNLLTKKSIRIYIIRQYPFSKTIR